MKHDLRRFSLGANLLLPIGKINSTLPKHSACKKKKKILIKYIFFPDPLAKITLRGVRWNSAISQ